MANTTFSGPVTSTAGFIGDIKVPTYTVANAPSASDAGAGTYRVRFKRRSRRSNLGFL